jgi:hypothetical protein
VRRVAVRSRSAGSSACTRTLADRREVPEQITFAFSCRWKDGEPRAGDECSGAGWFSVDEALELVEAPQQAGKLEDALAASPGVIYRSYKTLPYEVLYERRC